MEEALPYVADPSNVGAYMTPGSDFWMMSTGIIVIFILLIVWSLIWKGLALWRAARNGHVAWYVVLLLVNTVGILEILYYFIWGKPEGGS